MVEGVLGVGDRGQHPVVDVDQLGGGPGLFPRLRHDEGEDVPQVGGASADGDEHRPVLVDEADPQVAGDVGGGEDPHHPGGGLGAGHVDGEDVGSGMVGEAQEPVQHAGEPQVVDESPVAEGQLPGLVADAGGADPSDRLHLRNHPVGDVVDGVEDRQVAGAAAQVPAQVAGHLLPGEGVAFAVDEGLGSEEDPRGAEPALEGTVGGEGVGVQGPFGLVEAFEGEDLGSLHLGEGSLAADPGLPVDDDGAGATLARWGASVLGGGDTEFGTERGEQMWMVADFDVPSVESETGGGGALHPPTIRDLASAVRSLGAQGRQPSTGWLRAQGRQPSV